MREEKHIRVLFVRLFFFNDTGALHDEKPIYNQISQRKEEWCLLVLSCHQASVDVIFFYLGSFASPPMPRSPVCTFLGSTAPMVGSEGPSGAVSIYTLSHTQVRKTDRRSSKESNYLAAGGWPRYQDKDRGWERKWEVEPAQVLSAIRAANSSAGHSGSWWRTHGRLTK